MAVLRPDHRQCGHHCRAARLGRRERDAEETRRSAKGRGEGGQKGEGKGGKHAGAATAAEGRKRERHAKASSEARDLESGRTLQLSSCGEQRVRWSAARHAATQGCTSIGAMQQNAEVLVQLPENRVLSLARRVGLVFGKADEHFDGRRAPGASNGLSDKGDKTQALIDTSTARIEVCALEILIGARAGGSICERRGQIYAAHAGCDGEVKADRAALTKSW